LVRVGAPKVYQLCNDLRATDAEPLLFSRV